MFPETKDLLHICEPALLRVVMADRMVKELQFKLKLDARDDEVHTFIVRKYVIFPPKIILMKVNTDHQCNEKFFLLMTPLPLFSCIPHSCSMN